MGAMEPRLASRPPIACAGCHGQHPDRDHVDFRTAIDGPVVNAADPRVGRIDWVVLCEKCVTRAFELLPEQRLERENLQRTVAQLEERCEAAENFASTLESSGAAVEAARERVQRTRKAATPKRGGQRKSRYAAQEA